MSYLCKSINLECSILRYSCRLILSWFLFKTVLSCICARMEKYFTFFCIQFSQRSTVVSCNSEFSVYHKMSTIMRKSTIMKEIHAKIGKQSTENIHYSKRLHYYEIRYYQMWLFLLKENGKKIRPSKWKTESMTFLEKHFVQKNWQSHSFKVLHYLSFFWKDDLSKIRISSSLPSG